MMTTGAPPYFAARIALVFCAPMMVNGIALPFFPIWLETLSMNDSQIGIVLASATIITGMMVLAYLSGALAVVGLAFTAIGFFAPHAVHLM